jgi:hypothetical protein
MKKRSKHSLSNFKLLSGDMGELLPCGLIEVLPGDTIQAATSALIRCTPLLAPVMHPVEVRVHHWFVPHRLVWDDFDDFITEGASPTFPTIDFSGGVTSGTLANYLGLPKCSDAGSVSALPFRGYQMIYREWYQDQDLQTAPTIDTTDGVDSTTTTSLQSICWEKDRFASARPWTQKGNEVSLPLGTDAPVTGIGVNNTSWSTGPTNAYETDGSGAESYAKYLLDSSGKIIMEEDANNTGYPNVRADLSNATAATINDLREAMALQRYREARALYGSRYTEYLRYLGINPQDSRLDRPEYLGGGRQTIQFSEVLQTGVDSTDSGVGNLKGHGIGAMRSNRYRRFIPEHGYVFCLISIRPKAMYANGIPRHWIKTTMEDFYQKELSHIGAQEIYNKEIYADDTGPTDVFGYENRYNEYRSVQSSIAGDFAETAYEHWHLVRDFSSDIALNSSFVTCAPSERIFASTTNDSLLIMANHSIQARRLVPKVGAPGGF